MKHAFRNLAFVAAMMAIDAIGSCFSRLAERAFDGFHRLSAWLTDSIGSRIASLAFRAQSDAVTAPQLVAETAYMRRIQKRETPRVEARFRMCPST